MKCFGVKTGQVYHRNQFHFLTESNVLEVNFTVKTQWKQDYFIAKSKETKEFSQIVTLDYWNYFTNHLLKT